MQKPFAIALLSLPSARCAALVHRINGVTAAIGEPDLETADTCMFDLAAGNVGDQHADHRVHREEVAAGVDAGVVGTASLDNDGKSPGVGPFARRRQHIYAAAGL